LEVYLSSFLKRAFSYSILTLSPLGATDFKVASYNLENLFDLTLNGNEYRQYIPNRHGWNSKTLKIKLRNLSEVICEIDADIIALQEVENREALLLLQKSLKYYGCNYQYSATTAKNTSSVQVALLSRFKIYSRKTIEVPKEGYRDILEVKFNIDGKPLYIFVNHWKSKRGGRVSLLSGRVLKDRLKNMVGREYIVIGDFNSNYNEKRLTASLNSSRRLCNLDNNSNYNLWYQLPIYQRWSYNFYGKKEGLDNIIISSTLLDGKNIDYIKGSFNRFKPNYLFHKRGYILRWQYKSGRHIGVGYSDHLPIYASFSTKKRFEYPNCNIYSGNISKLKAEDVKLPIRLKAVEVIRVQKSSAYIRDGSGEIKIFGIDKRVRVGEILDIVIYRLTTYNSELEIIDFQIEKSYHNGKKES